MLIVKSLTFIINGTFNVKQTELEKWHFKYLKLYLHVTKIPDKGKCRYLSIVRQESIQLIS